MPAVICQVGYRGGSSARKTPLPFTLQAVWRVSVPASSARRYDGSRARGEWYSKRQIYLPFTIAASGGCERARKEISRFAARARRGVNVQNEIRFDAYDKNGWLSKDFLRCPKGLVARRGRWPAALKDLLRCAGGSDEVLPSRYQENTRGRFSVRTIVLMS